MSDGEFESDLMADPMEGDLLYETPEEARAVADDIGLNDVHSHDLKPEKAGGLMFAPGKSHSELNEAFPNREVPDPGEKQASMDDLMGDGRDGML
jgi:hypothetical protein